MNRRLSLLMLLLLSLCLPLAACAPNHQAAHRAHPVFAPTQADCAAIAGKIAALKNSALDNSAAKSVRITRADLITSDAQYPAYCLVQGKVNERTGIDGKSYAIGFEMRLPTAWSGRFLYQANGGNDGVVVPAEGDGKNLNVVGRVTALARGFAVLSTDAGHNGADPVNASTGLLSGNVFGFDPQARLDYGYMATATMTPIAKSIIRSYYGIGPSYSYMFGCSNGGRHGMVAASRFPGLF